MKRIDVPYLDRSCSQLVLGTMAFSFERRDHWWRLMDAYFEAGGNCVDTAYVYYGGESERVIGEWIQARGCRDEMIVLTKGAHPLRDGKPRVTPEAILHDFEISRERLGVETIDLYLLHRDDPAVPVDEIVDCLHGLRQQGKVRAYGGSNWSVHRLQQANDYARTKGLTPFAASSPNFSLAVPNVPRWPGCVSVMPEDLAWYETAQMPLFSWSSQASGFFTGRYAPDKTDHAEMVRVYYSQENWNRYGRARKLAAAKGVDANQIALAYVLCQPFPTFALIGPLTNEELKSSMRAVDVLLSREEVMWLDGRLPDPSTDVGG